MSSFDTPLHLEFLDGRTWLLLAGFRFISCTGDLIEVPAGFVTDFASVPRFFWRVFPPTGRYGKAAVIHDYLYQFPGDRHRSACDAILLDGMEVLGCGWWTRQLIYRAVRLGGWRPWGEYRDDDREDAASHSTYEL